MAVPWAVIGEAAWAMAAITILAVGCAIDGSWWSLAAAGFCLLALGIWALFRPGVLPCVLKRSSMDPSNGQNCCGGQLWSLWGAWLTSLMGTSAVGLLVTLFHNETVRRYLPSHARTVLELTLLA